MKQKGRLQKGLATFFLLVCFVTMSCITVLAASAVTSLTVNVRKQGNSKYPTITVSNSGRCEITNQTEWSKAEAELIPGEEISCVITVMPKEGYYFDLRNSISVSGARKGRIDSTNGGYNIPIYYTVPGRLDIPLNAYWDPEEPWFAVVDENPYADEYEYVIYVEGEEIKRITRTTSKVSFARTLASVYKAKDVYFEVRAKSADKDIKSSSYARSEDFTEWSKLRRLCREERIAINEDYHCNYNDDDDYYNNDYGYSSGIPSSYYVRRDRSVLTTTPTTDGYWTGGAGNWYYWRSDGTPANGWIARNGYWYYIVKGRLVTGWLNLGDRRYYLNPNRDGLEGAMVTGWQNIERYWYYFYYEGEGGGHVHGEMAKSRYIDNSYVNDVGKWSKEK